MSDLLLQRVRLVPITPYDVPPAEPVDVLVRNGVVAEVAPRLSADSVPIWEADGRWLIPGLWDAHVHLGQWAAASERLDTSGARSAEDLYTLVSRLVAGAPHTSTTGAVIGHGHRPAAWPDQPTVAALDAVVGDRVVVLISGDAHHALLSSAALRRLGLPGRDEPVSENEWFAVQDEVRALAGDEATSPAAYRAAMARAAADGVVGLVDFEFDNSLDSWRERWSAGADLLRIRVALYPDAIDGALGSGLRTGHRLLPGEDRLTMGPLKIISDGSLNTRTAWCHRPYVGTDDHGAANLTSEELTGLLRRAHAGGLAVATHAIGDAALATALAAYDRTGATGSIEHAQLVRRDDVATLARLGLRASVQPAHLIDDRDLTDQIWVDRTEGCFALRWMTEAGVPLVLGSDAPVAPLDPWLALDAAVRRTGDDRGPWHPEQALTRREALAASVDGRPMVGAGSPGDLVLLEEDPLAIDATRPRVALTTVAGRVVHEQM